MLNRSRLFKRHFCKLVRPKLPHLQKKRAAWEFLNPQDRIVVNREHLLTEAKKEVLHMVASGYQPPAPELIYAAGRDMYGAMRIGAWMFKEGNYITEYDHHIARKLALCDVLAVN